jgi:hypothetical protein
MKAIANRTKKRPRIGIINFKYTEQERTELQGVVKPIRSFTWALVWCGGSLIPNAIDEIKLWIDRGEEKKFMIVLLMY